MKDTATFIGPADLPSTVNKLSNIIRKTHQKLTKAGAKYAKIKISDDLTNGSMWPDCPSEKALDVNFAYTAAVITEIIKADENDTVRKSHFGENQYWHSMCPKLPSKKTLTNEDVKDMIMKQLEKWYKEALEYKEKKNTRKSLFALGKLCHVIQDSFVLSHCWRRYYGDEKFIGLKRIKKGDHGKIWTFQDYAAQDGNFHAMADSPKQDEDAITIGYESAEYATKEIMFRYSENFMWGRGRSGVGSPREFLEKVYEIYPGREDEASGGSHPWFKNGNTSRAEVGDNLTAFSQSISEWKDKLFL